MRRAKTLIGRRFLLQRLGALSFPTRWALHCVAVFKSVGMFAVHESCLSINHKTFVVLFATDYRDVKRKI